MENFETWFRNQENISAKIIDTTAKQLAESEDILGQKDFIEAYRSFEETISSEDGKQRFRKIYEKRKKELNS